MAVRPAGFRDPSGGPWSRVDFDADRDEHEYDSDVREHLNRAITHLKMEATIRRRSASQATSLASRSRTASGVASIAS